MDKIAIISDIHGNLEALKTVLKDIEDREINHIYCLGDIIGKGIHTKECIELIKEKCEVVIQGNCDRFFASEHDLEKEIEINQKRILWNQKLLNKEERTYLLNLPFSYEFYMSGSYIRLFHATPYQIDKAIINQDDFETKYQLFMGTDKTETKKISDVAIYGHIHHCYMDVLYNKTILNAGSVGNSFCVIRNDKKDSNQKEITNAFYLILEGHLGDEDHREKLTYQFVRVPYNIQKEMQEAKDVIEKDAYFYELTKGKYRNMTKIEQNFKRLGIDPEKI